MQFFLYILKGQFTIYMWKSLLLNNIICFYILGQGSATFQVQSSWICIRLRIWIHMHLHYCKQRSGSGSARRWSGSALLVWCIAEVSMFVLPKWQFGTSFSAPDALTRRGARTFLLILVVWSREVWNELKKVRAPRRVSASGAPHIVTWIKQTWIKKGAPRYRLLYYLETN